MAARDPQSDRDPLNAVRAAIEASAAIARRDPSDIELIAVSKTRGASEIAGLIAQGQRVFGESRVQEAADKWPELRAVHPGVALHMVGRLQSNKAHDAVRLFDAIHSLDRASLVRALAKACEAEGRQPRLFVQVNIGDEPQKGGCALAGLSALLAQADDAGLTVSGLMAVPPLNVEPAPYFALLAELAARSDLAALSMGMSADFETAVMLGATHVRVGSALFGPRPA